MIEKGTWTGSYRFSDPKINKIRGFEQTNFVIQIREVDGESFSGTVEDDLSTGGMEGVGEIHGKVIGDRIEFVKQMPRMTLLVDKNGTRKTQNKKHRLLYYSGQFSADKKEIKGAWKFKPGFIWYGIIPIPVGSTKGTWTMDLKEEPVKFE